MRIGDFEVYSVVTGTFRLDGGAMFGVVPKTLWENPCPPDEQNRIPLATRTLLIRHRPAGRVILVDTGCGPKWSEKEASRFAIRHNSEAIPQALSILGLQCDDVTDVIVTHLHFDHNGGLTGWTDDKMQSTKLLFSRARHWLHEKQWHRALHPHVKDKASYLKQDFEALADSGVLRLVSGDEPQPMFDGLRCLVSHGHTPYQLHPIIESGDKSILFTGDLFPTVAHLRPTWVMAYDVEPMRTIEEKSKIIRDAMEQGLLLAFPHDPSVGGVRLTGSVDRPIVTESLALDVPI